MHRTIWAVLLTAFGALTAFFGVFRLLFADGPASLFDGEYMAAYAQLVLMVGLLSFIGARYSPWARWSAAFVGAPGLLVALVYIDGGFALNAMALVCLLIGAVLGLTGAHLMPRQPAPDGPTAT